MKRAASCPTDELDVIAEIRQGSLRWSGQMSFTVKQLSCDVETLRMEMRSDLGPQTWHAHSRQRLIEKMRAYMNTQGRIVRWIEVSV